MRLAEEQQPEASLVIGNRGDAASGSSGWERPNTGRAHEGALLGLSS